MQILEQLAIGDIEFVVEEGLFQSKVDDGDYKEFIKLCKFIANLCKMPKEEKWQANNDRSIEKLSNKPGAVSFNCKRGNMRGVLKLPTKSNLEKNYTDYHTPSTDQIMTKIVQSSKLRMEKHWVVNYTNGIETGRSINMIGPIGNNSWCKVGITVHDYHNEFYETTVIFLMIRPIKKGDMKKYDKRA